MVSINNAVCFRDVSLLEYSIKLVFYLDFTDLFCLLTIVKNPCMTCSYYILTPRDKPQPLSVYCHYHCCTDITKTYVIKQTKRLRLWRHIIYFSQRKYTKNDRENCKNRPLSGKAVAIHCEIADYNKCLFSQLEFILETEKCQEKRTNTKKSTRYKSLFL